MYTYIDPNTPAGAGGVTTGQAQKAAESNEPQGKQLSKEELKKMEQGAASQRAAIAKRYQFFKEWQESNDPDRGDPTIAKNLEGMTLKLGTGDPDYTLDTGIQLNPHWAAALVGVGDQMGDLGRGMKQLLQENGLADDLIDIEAQDANENIMRRLYEDPTFKGSAITGAVVGAIAEPVGALTGLKIATSTAKGLIASSAVMGSTVGGLMYVDGDESRKMNAAIGGLFGAAVGGVLAKYTDFAVGSKVSERINHARNFEAEQEAGVYAKWAANKEARGAAGNIAGGEGRHLPGVQTTGDIVDDVMPRGGHLRDETGTPTDWFDEQVGALDSPRKRRLMKRQNKANQEKLTPKDTPPKSSQEVLEGVEARASITGKRQGKYHEVKAIFDAAVRPIYDNLAQYTSKVAKAMRLADGKQHLMQAQWVKASDEWTKWVNKLDKGQQRALKAKLLNDGFNKGTLGYIRDIGGDLALEHAKGVRSVLDEIHARLGGVGYKIGKIEGYFPRGVKDLDSLRKKHKGTLDALAAKERKISGSGQKANFDQRYFEQDIKRSGVSGSVNRRMKNAIDDEDLDHYHSLNDTLSNYIHANAEDIAKREFFAGYGHKPGKKGLDTTGADIDDSIDTIVKQLADEGMDFAEQREVANLMRSRFSNDVTKTHRFVQDLKNLSYAGTLGNFWSAMTQVGDLVFAFHKYGIKAALGGLFGTRVTNKTRMGIEKAMAELESEKQRITNKIADKAFQWSGFQKVDAFGKNVNINASLRANRRLAMKNPKKFVEKWGEHFGDDTANVIRDLGRLSMKKDEYVSDNIHLMLWNDLADTQPIGLSEMPKKYLDMPNGRILYAYKTFSLKQFNYMRNTLMKGEGNQFQRGVDLAYFATIFTLANGTIDGFKDFMSGDDVDPESVLAENLYKLVGTSKYATEKSQGLGGIISQMLQPVPLVQAAKALDQLQPDPSSFSKAGDSLMNQIPIVGKAKKEWLDK
jgi:hypothetical protein